MGVTVYLMMSNKFNKIIKKLTKLIKEFISFINSFHLQFLVIIKQTECIIILIKRDAIFQHSIKINNLIFFFENKNIMKHIKMLN